MKNLRKNYHCWITNLTKMKIVVGDLKITLQPLNTIDILDYKHSRLTPEQVSESIKKGSLCLKKKENKIKIRSSEPDKLPPIKTLELSKSSFPYKNRSLLVLEEKIFDELELDISDEEFAMENADSAMEEHLSVFGNVSEYVNKDKL